MAEPGAAADAFWNFSLGFYGRPGVKEACLELQDVHGRDVNLVLYLCWLGLSGRGRIERKALGEAEAVIEAWRKKAVEPLRAARRALKAEEQAGIAELYEAAKAVELTAERLGQWRLAALAPAPSARGAGDGAGDAVANLELYLRKEGERKAARPIVAALAFGA